ncbi:hypothetical protein WR25_23764 [Diploscapter pachys]|uniref:Uncharacterized protein n=1 Tax=Diploscapter pachys TaxID=2018661 RepID=A0A2A2M1C4_9BILA|nr:hypothetical protein WR25_23764 [Diploscapter pachys]
MRNGVENDPQHGSRRLRDGGDIECVERRDRHRNDDQRKHDATDRARQGARVGGRRAADVRRQSFDMARGDDGFDRLLRHACQDITEEKDQTGADDPRDGIAEAVQHVGKRTRRASEAERLRCKEEGNQQNDPERSIPDLRTDRRLIAWRMVGLIGAPRQRRPIDEVRDAPFDGACNQPSDQKNDQRADNARPPFLRVHPDLVRKVAGPVDHGSPRIADIVHINLPEPRPLPSTHRKMRPLS